MRVAADLAQLRHPGTGIVHEGKSSRVLPVKFYRIEHEMIGPIAERFGGLRPEPDSIVAEALGVDYLTRWTRYRADGRTPLAAAAVPRAIEAPAIRELTAEPAELAEPGRRQAITMLRSAGVRGMTVRGIAERLATEGQEVAHQTLHRWLTEEAAAGRVQDAPYGRWKWKPPGDGDNDGAA